MATWDASPRPGWARSAGARAERANVAPEAMATHRSSVGTVTLDAAEGSARRQ
jgi:hypothetical protein